MKMYQHRNYTSVIVKAERFKKRLADRVEIKHVLFFPVKEYIVMITSPVLGWLKVRKSDYIVYRETKERIYKMLYPKKEFKKLFKEIKE